MSKEKEYIVSRDTAIEAMSHLDEFHTKMDNFVKLNPNYNYASSLDFRDNKWYITVKVQKNEPTNIKGT